MTTKTRNFVLASLLVLCAGLGIGFLAYVARATSALAAPSGTALPAASALR